jgi:arsenate reductase
MSTVIYHNPACGTSRNVLGLIRNSGEEPVIIEYLKNPPSRQELISLIGRMGIPVRDLLRRKGTPYEELKLDDPTLTDDQLIDAMMAHPILINRPIVVTPRGVKLCRPSEVVLDILPNPQRGAFAKEDGEVFAGIQPCTVRGVAYQLFTRGLIENMGVKCVRTVSRLLVIAREQGRIPWSWIVDDTRQEERNSSWDCLSDFGETITRAYRKDFWQHQHGSRFSQKSLPLAGSFAPS